MIVNLIFRGNNFKDETKRQELSALLIAAGELLANNSAKMNAIKDEMEQLRQDYIKVQAEQLKDFQLDKIFPFSCFLAFVFHFTFSS